MQSVRYNAVPGLPLSDGHGLALSKEAVMASFSWTYSLLLLCAIILWFVPLYTILGKIGWRRGWACVAIFPPAAMVLLWCIAFGRWRSGEARSSL